MTRLICTIFFAFFLSALGIHGASTPQSSSQSSYHAGVVEFLRALNTNLTDIEKLEINLAGYFKILESAPAQNLDIIVFPESSLNSMSSAALIPEPEDKISPCDNSKYAEEILIKDLSCAAKAAKKYVVINLTEKVECPDKQMIASDDKRACRNGLSFYNVNVVFDRNGVVIARYRKFNLFGEEVDKPKLPEAVTFETDFGVTFGTFICFDLMFRKPALDMARSKNITDFIFPTMWFSELPFLTAVQIQQNWAFKNNVNLLASGASNPPVGSTGTGIYAGKLGVLVSTMTGDGESALYVAEVPKIGSSNIAPQTQGIHAHTPVEMDKLYLKRDHLDSFITKEIIMESTQSTTVKGSFDAKLCDGELCCTFLGDYDFKSTSRDETNYKYRMVVKNGQRTFDGFADGGVVVCAVIACWSDDLKSCGVRFNDSSNLDGSVRFTRIEVAGTFLYDDQYFILPTQLDTKIMPFGINEFEYVEGSTFEWEGKPSRNITMNLLQPHDDLLAFGIYGRNFNLDSAANTSVLSFIILIIGMFITYIS